MAGILQSKLPSGLYLISSHDEGRRAGLSSAHVDPTHIWERFGLTMDGFRADVAEKMKLELRAGMKVRLIRAIALRNGVSAKYQQAGYVKYTDLPASVKKKCKRIAGEQSQAKSGGGRGNQGCRADPGWNRVDSDKERLGCRWW